MGLNPAPPVLVARREQGREQPVSGPLASPVIVPVAATTGNGETVYPDLSGLNARDAVRILAKLGIGARVNGAGFVVDQQPAAGSPLHAAAVARLWLERYPRRQATAPQGP